MSSSQFKTQRRLKLKSMARVQNKMSARQMESVTIRLRALISMYQWLPEKEYMRFGTRKAKSTCR